MNFVIGVSLWISVGLFFAEATRWNWKRYFGNTDRFPRRLYLFSVIIPPFGFGTAVMSTGW